MHECTNARMRQCGFQVHFAFVHFLHLCIPAFVHFYTLSGSNCGVKSLPDPGTLYSYGPR
jgi:hypothetical protein